VERPHVRVDLRGREGGIERVPERIGAIGRPSLRMGKHELAVTVE